MSTANRWDREVSVGKFGVSTECATDDLATAARRIEDELRADVRELVAARTSPKMPSRLRVAHDNLCRGSGLTSIATIYAAAQARYAGAALIPYPAAERFALAPLRRIAERHPDAAAYSQPWTQEAEERSIEWESATNDAQDAAERELARRPHSLAAAVAVVETTTEQRLASEYRKTVSLANVARLAIQQKQGTAGRGR